ncbi:pancreatic triacylglycerol lipase [Biomphalaria pfeifferi]|uniref:Pancreatic triacylglycerol lipase n=1 Tax=Biomphalaria pfeifferi TaxID=112525 RepID=A0AAD8C3R8_BIOPF|nr:pancreatic triacylglycerol lipase [Biomphalaria pfeifferi]
MWFQKMSTVTCLLLSCSIQVKTVTATDKRAAVCFDRLGCFATEGPFGISLERPLVLPPERPEQIGTIFQLYTRDRFNHSINLPATRLDNLTAAWAQLKNKPTKILSHGFLDNPNVTPYQRNLKDELLAHGDYNVIIVDWSNGNSPPYTQATANTRVVGAQIGLLVDELIKTKAMSASDFHLIGHSLGAQISGYAGERIPGLARISGIDPASPYFENTDPVVRLDPTDAVFVDVIHSDAPPLGLLQLGLGMKQAVGHLDFYPNLGRDQPGCTRNPFTQIAQWGLVEGSTETLICNHMRAFHYYVESINTKCPFVGYPCNKEEDFTSGVCKVCPPEGCPYMGFHADKTKLNPGQRQKIYLTTNDQKPFCMYHLELTVKMSSENGQTEKGYITVDIVGDQGRTNEVRLNSRPINFEVGKNYLFSVPTASDLGKVHTVKMSFDHVSSLLDIFQFGLRQPQIYIDEIEIFYQEKNKKFRFSLADFSVETDQSVIVFNQN